MELLRKTIAYCDLLLDNASVYEENADAIVPDAFPDIARIVYADGMISVKDETPQNDRVLISGMVNVAVLYQPEGQPQIQRLDIPLSFAHIEEAYGIDKNSVCFVRCRVAEMCARAVNSRKVSVTAKLCIEMTVYQPAELQYTEQIQPEDTGLQVQYDTQELTLISAVHGDTFTILDDLEWTNADGLELVHTDCQLRLQENRAMHGRLLLRGEAQLTLLLQDDTNTLQQVTKSIPFQQIIEIDSLTEGEKTGVRLAVRSLDVALTAMGMLSVGIGVETAVLREEKHHLQTIHDLYHTGYDLQVQAVPVTVCGCTLCGGFSADGSETVPLGMKTTQFLGAKAVCTGIQAEGDQRYAKIEVSILYYDEENCPYQTHRALRVPLHHTMQEMDTVWDASVQTTLSPSGEDSVNLIFSLNGMLCRQPRTAFQDVTAAAYGEAHTPPDAAMILRRVDEGESLWELAKQYTTTMAIIRGANALPDDQQTTGKQLLLIPRMP